MISYIVVHGDTPPKQDTTLPEKEIPTLVDFLKDAEYNIELQPLHTLALKTTFHKYRREQIESALRLMGCKPPHALAIVDNVFASLGAVVKETIASPSPLCVVLTEQQLERIMHCALVELRYYRYVHLRDFQLARQVMDRRKGFMVLLGGTAGSGKSTLSLLLASRLGVSTIISTDNIRHAMRSVISKEQSPALWASSYGAGAVIDVPDSMSIRERTVRGFQVQNELLFGKMDHVLHVYEQRREPVIIEGVHLSADAMMELMQRHPSAIPFAIFISNQEKHRERFSIRAKYMTLDMRHNRYAKHFRFIRYIQDYVVERAHAMDMPCIDNTNVDRSVAIIHSTIFGCLEATQPLLDEVSQRCTEVLRIHEQGLQISWSSKRMLQLIQRRKATREKHRMDDKSGDGDDGEEKRYYFQQGSGYGSLGS